MVCTLNVGITLNFQLAILLSARWVFLTNMEDDMAFLHCFAESPSAFVTPSPDVPDGTWKAKIPRKYTAELRIKCREKPHYFNIETIFKFETCTGKPLAANT